MKEQTQDLSQQIAGYVRLLESILQSDEDQFAYMKLHALASEPSIYSMAMDEGARLLATKGYDLETLLDTILVDFQAMQQAVEAMGGKLVAAEQAVSPGPTSSFSPL